MPTCFAGLAVWERPPARASLPRPSTASISRPTVSHATSASRARHSTSNAPTTSWSSMLPATTRWMKYATSPIRCVCRLRWAVTVCSSSTRSTCCRRRRSTRSSRLLRSHPSMPSSSSPLPRSRKLSPPSCLAARFMTLLASLSPTLWSNCSTSARTRALPPSLQLLM